MFCALFVRKKILCLYIRIKNLYILDCRTFPNVREISGRKEPTGLSVNSRKLNTQYINSKAIISTDNKLCSCNIDMKIRIYIQYKSPSVVETKINYYYSYIKL